MATKRSKNADTERLDEAHFEHAIKMLEPTDGTKAWTKKDACAYLGIAYNTTRLAALIQKYQEDKAKNKARRAEKRGTPATQAEIQYIVSSYLEGVPIDSIGASLYRGTTFVKAALFKYSVPIRQTAHSYFRPELVPEDACKDKFAIGEKVYSMRYDSLALIKSEYSPGVYAIYLLAEKWRQFAYQPNYELASLAHLKEAGISV